MNKDSVKGSNSGVLAPVDIVHVNDFNGKIHVNNEKILWIMIYRSQSQNDTTMFKSILGRKCTPILMTVGQMVNSCHAE